MCPTRSRSQDSRRRARTPSRTGAAADPRATRHDESNEWARARLRNTNTSVGMDASLGDQPEREGGGYRGANTSARAGAWRDDETGRVRMGAQGSASAGSMDLYYAQLDGPAASANAYVGDDGLAIGAGASVGGVSTSLRNNDPEETDWLDGRIGLSEGVGLEVRGHWSDNDNDGREERGFGIDVGPLSLDLTTEAFSDEEQPAEAAEATPAQAPAAAPEPAPRSPAVHAPVVDHGPGPASAGPVWDEESRTSVLAARTGRPMNQLMQLQLQGGYRYDRREIRRALREFQREQDLEVTGEFDDATVRALGH